MQVDLYKTQHRIGLSSCVSTSFPSCVTTRGADVPTALPDVPLCSTKLSFRPEATASACFTGFPPFPIFRVDIGSDLPFEAGPAFLQQPFILAIPELPEGAEWAEVSFRPFSLLPSFLLFHDSEWLPISPVWLLLFLSPSGSSLCDSAMI